MRRSDTARRAFTLLEMMIVIVIIGLMAALIMPRLGASENRHFELAVDRTSDLLLMYAQRESMGNKPVGIVHDLSSNELRLVVLDRPDAWDQTDAEWIVDPLVRPVELPSQIIPADNIEIRSDGEVIDTAYWPLTADAGEQRPSVEIRLRGPVREVTLVLPAHGIGPYKRDSARDGLVEREPIDLDAEGRDREDW